MSKKNSILIIASIVTSSYSMDIALQGLANELQNLADVLSGDVPPPLPPRPAAVTLVNDSNSSTAPALNQGVQNPAQSGDPSEQYHPTPGSSFRSNLKKKTQASGQGSPIITQPITPTTSTQVPQAGSFRSNLQRKSQTPKKGPSISPTSLTPMGSGKAINQQTQDKLLQGILNDSKIEILDAIKRGAEVNHIHDGKTPLCSAVLLKRPIATKTLLEQGADANFKYLNQPLTLHALKTGNPGGALLLLQHGADYTVTDKSNYGIMYNTLIMLYQPSNRACMNDILRLLQNIIDHNRSTHAEYNINDIWNQDIHTIDRAIFDHQEVLNLFLKNGANPSYAFKNVSGGYWTPILLAILFGKIDAIKTLIDAGADVNQKSNPLPEHTELSGEHTPVSFASARGQHTIIDLLLKHGARL